jgi:hypothetical protein
VPPCDREVDVRLENIVWNACDPHRLGMFWAAALGAQVMTDDADGFEARLALTEEAFIDLCLQPVSEPCTSPPRLHLDLAGGDRQAEVVEHLLSLGARYADIGQGDVPWVVLADPEENAFCVMEHRAVYPATGPIAALPLDSADPERDAHFWVAITGWLVADGNTPATLRHPAGVGPLLELCPEPEAKRGTNGIHLDVRPASGDPDALSIVRPLGGRTLEWPGAVGKPWTVCADPSGNEFCVLASA